MLVIKRSNFKLYFVSTNQFQIFIGSFTNIHLKLQIMDTNNLEIEKNLVKEVSSPLYNSKGWIKLLGILLLIYGVMIAISIVGLLIAWLPIWIGILLIQASSKIEQAQNLGDKIAMISAQKSLSTYFTIYGALALIGIIMMVIVMTVFFATGMFNNFQEFIPDYY